MRQMSQRFLLLGILWLLASRTPRHESFVPLRLS
jgi:hypothetical protein